MSTTEPQITIIYCGPTFQAAIKEELKKYATHVTLICPFDDEEIARVTLVSADEPARMRRVLLVDSDPISTRRFGKSRSAGAMMSQLLVNDLKLSAKTFVPEKFAPFDSGTLRFIERPLRNLFKPRLIFQKNRSISVRDVRVNKRKAWIKISKRKLE